MPFLWCSLRKQLENMFPIPLFHRKTTYCQQWGFVSGPDTWPPDQLAVVLSGSSDPFAKLDDLYLQILCRVPAPEYLLLPILAYVLATSSIHTIEFDLQLRPGTVRSTLRRMHAVLCIPDSDCEDIKVVHSSFDDFLSNKRRSRQFHVSSKIYRDTFMWALNRMGPGTGYLECQMNDNTSNYILDFVTDQQDKDHILYRVEAIMDELPFANLIFSQEGNVYTCRTNMVRSSVPGIPIYEAEEFEAYDYWLSFLCLATFRFHDCQSVYDEIGGLFDAAMNNRLPLEMQKHPGKLVTCLVQPY
jgi:hypothetical protein